MYLVRDIRTNEYRTIHKQDVQKFYDLADFFEATDSKGEPVFNFEVITDSNKIKEIVKTHFTSKGRGEEYNENMPSVSQVSSKLYPIDIETDKSLMS